jgi:hypothetical protein
MMTFETLLGMANSKVYKLMFYRFYCFNNESLILSYLFILLDKNI